PRPSGDGSTAHSRNRAREGVPCLPNRSPRTASRCLAFPFTSGGANTRAKNGFAPTSSFTLHPSIPAICHLPFAICLLTCSRPIEEQSKIQMAKFHRLTDYLERHIPLVLLPDRRNDPDRDGLSFSHHAAHYRENHGGPRNGRRGARSDDLCG